MSLKRIYTRKEKPNCPKIPQRPMVPVTTLVIYITHDKVKTLTLDVYMKQVYP